MKKLIIILGMHRSGTSAMAGLLKESGVYFGDALLEASEHNEKGHFEDIEIYKLQDKIMQQILQSSWSDSELFLSNWKQKIFEHPFYQQLEENIVRIALKKNIAAIKDPRTTRLLPIWFPILDRHNIQPYFIIMIRKPIEVVKSLIKRDHKDSFAEIVNLWFRYTKEAEQNTQNYPRVFVNFESFLDCPKNVFTTITNTFSLDLNFPAQNLIEKSLKHQDDESPYNILQLDLANIIFDNLNYYSVKPNENSFENFKKLCNLYEKLYQNSYDVSIVKKVTSLKPSEIQEIVYNNSKLVFKLLLKELFHKK